MQRRFPVWTLVSVLLLVVGWTTLGTSTQASVAPPALDASVIVPQAGQPVAVVERRVMPPVDVDKLRAEDALAPKDSAARFAQRIPVGITPADSGLWETVDGAWQWRLRVASDKAVSLNFGFGQFALPPGAALWLSQVDGSEVIGPFTSADNDAHGELWTPVISGGEALLTLRLPLDARPALRLVLTSVNHGYRGMTDAQQEKSGSCNVDVVCSPQADGWRDQIRSVAVYSINGTFACTGALINNTAQNLKPYFLTAAHCSVTASAAPSVVTYWNYQNTFCRAPGGTQSGQPGDGSLAQALTGTILRANYAPSDVTLLELDDPMPSAFNAFWAGWDRSGANATSAAIIHHPRTDEKRFTFDTGPTGIASYNGTTEPGSSGSPIFDQNKRIIGQLHGGPASCTNTTVGDYYGRVFISWTGGGATTSRLREWLDPTASNVNFLDGRDAAPDFAISAAPAVAQVCAPAAASYTVSLVPTLGFSATVTLSSNGTPPGYSAAFTPPSLAPPGTSTLNLTNIGAATPGIYNIVITGSGGSLVHTTTTTLNLATLSPNTPPLSGPAAGAANQPIRPTLSWTGVTQGFGYTVEVATDAAFASIVYTGTTASTTHTLASDLLEGTVYYWRVRAANGCGASSNSATRSFSTVVGPAACGLGVAPNVVYSTDFESGAAGWTHTGTGDTWALQSARVHGGTQAWLAADPATVSDQRLVSPAIAVPAGAISPTLQFWNRQSFESRSAGGCYDGGIVGVSTNGGTNWTQMPNAALRTDPYNGAVNASSNPLDGSQAWCGDPQEFLNSVVDISTYAGQTVNFRFRLGSDNSVGREGWAIDDVKVQTCNGGPTATATAAPSATSTPTAAPSPTATASPVAVAISNFAFVPQNLTINQGQSVTWTNNDGGPHTTTSGTSPTANGLWNSGNLATGQSFTFAFNTLGMYPYFCTRHTNMTGSVNVVPLASPTSTTTSTATATTTAAPSATSTALPPSPTAMPTATSVSGATSRIFLPFIRR